MAAMRKHEQGKLVEEKLARTLALGKIANVIRAHVMRRRQRRREGVGGGGGPLKRGSISREVARGRGYLSSNSNPLSPSPSPSPSQSQALRKAPAAAGGVGLELSASSDLGVAIGGGERLVVLPKALVAEGARGREAPSPLVGPAMPAAAAAVPDCPAPGAVLGTTLGPAAVKSGVASDFGEIGV